jgi:hypothetical protein
MRPLDRSHPVAACRLMVIRAEKISASSPPTFNPCRQNQYSNFPVIFQSGKYIYFITKQYFQAETLLRFIRLVETKTEYLPAGFCAPLPSSFRHLHHAHPQCPTLYL